MARKLRLEYPGARYHVISRGNYRADIFASRGAKEAFEGCLLEACEKSKWILHAFVVMRNHYHLALETPEGNLVEGMRWLQSTFANRFNRLRREQGHVFQGRYHALLIESGPATAAVVHYIHLNPVRAQIVPLERLSDYRYSSFYFYKGEVSARPRALEVETTLAAVGDLRDTPSGRNKYAEYLAWLAEDRQAQKELRFEDLCRGWALGGAEFKKALLEDHQEKINDLSDGLDQEVHEARELTWKQALARCMTVLKKGDKDIQQDRKSADWKVAIAAHLKAISTVKNPWLAETLRMGDPDGVSRYASELRGGKRPNAKKLQEKITDIRV